MIDEKFCNQDEDIKDCITYKNKFKCGKQGITGLVKIGEKISVFKISQYINHLCEQENINLRSLNQLSNFCIHFCKGYDKYTTKLDADFKNSENPLQVRTKYPIKNDILLMEYISDSFKFYNYIKNEEVNEDILYSTIKQVLMAINIAQRFKKFTHYDLHSDNIMMKKCKDDLVMLYIIDEKNQYLVPTNGYIPKIIDFGFSYNEDMNDLPLWQSMGHTDIGFTSSYYDSISDTKLLLCSSSTEIKSYRNSKKSKKLRKLVKNIFEPLSVDFSCGWDKYSKYSISDEINIKLSKYNRCSEFFEKYEHFCIDLIQTLIITPIQKQDTQLLKTAYEVFLKEWIKIENEISEPFYCLYFLKCIVDNARLVRHIYMTDEKKKAVHIFFKGLFVDIDSVSKFFNPKDLNYEKLLCSLYILSDSIEGLMFEKINKLKSKKEKEYKNLKYTNVEQIYGKLEMEIPETYEFNNNTEVLVFDCICKNTNLLKIRNKKDIEHINSQHNLCKPKFLFKYYKELL